MGCLAVPVCAACLALAGCSQGEAGDEPVFKAQMTTAGSGAALADVASASPTRGGDTGHVVIY